MFRNFFSIDKSYWLLVPAIMHATIPWFAFRIRIWLVFFFVLCWMAININRFIGVFSLRQSRTFKLTIFWLCAYNLLNNLYALFGHGDFTGYNGWAMFVNQLAFFMIVHYTIIAAKTNELRFLSACALAGIAIAGLMSLRGAGMENVEGARALVGTGAKELDMERLDVIMTAAILGLGDYRYVYMCAWLFPLMLVTFNLAKNKAMKIVCVVVAIACVISVKMGGLGTPAVLLGISTLMYFAWLISRSTRVVKVIGYSLVIVISLYFTAPIIFRPLVVPLQFVAENMQDGSIKQRLILLADSFSGDEENYARERSRLQLISWQTFCKYPILGEGMYQFKYGETPKNRIGGHSLVLDRLATSGIVGFLPFVFLLYFLNKYYSDITRGRFNQKWRVIPSMFIALYVFSSIANPMFGVPHMMYIIMPGLAYLITISRKEYPYIVETRGPGPTPFPYGGGMPPAIGWR